MKILKISLAIVAVLLIVLAIAAPIGPVPGFFIGGTSAAPPASWPDTSDVDEIRLRVPGSLPRVVIIWVIEYQDELYVVGAKGSGWVSMLGEGGPVHMRLGDRTYPLTATPVLEGWQPVFEAYIEKYRPNYPDIVAGLPSVEQAGDQVAVFRLDRS
jgi:hypothetical protein